MKITLSPTERRALRASAHGLDPVVMIGQDGLTPPVLREIERAVVAHELIKIRVLGDDRDERAQLLDSICDALGCAPVQHIGKILVIWRRNEEKAKAAKAAAARAAQKPKPPRLTRQQEEAKYSRRRVVRK
jgi:RNA-binding protein